MRSWKQVMAWSALVMAVMACAVQMAGQSPTPSASAAPTQKLRIDIISPTNPITTTVTASEWVRLRDRPDAAGPVDSHEIAVLHDGDVFQVTSCQKSQGDWWAYGMFHVEHGWVKAIYLSPNPCK